VADLTNPKISTPACNDSVDALLARANGGFIRLYSGTQPSDCDNPPTPGSTLLAEMTMSNPAFNPAQDGAALAKAIMPDAAANADGVASWFRMTEPNGSPVWDGSVGKQEDPQDDLYDLYLNSCNIVKDASVGIASLAYIARREK